MHTHHASIYQVYIEHYVSISSSRWYKYYEYTRYRVFIEYISSIYRVYGEATADSVLDIHFSVAPRNPLYENRRANVIAISYICILYRVYTPVAPKANPPLKPIISRNESWRPAKGFLIQRKLICFRLIKWCARCAVDNLVGENMFFQRFFVGDIGNFPILSPGPKDPWIKIYTCIYEYLYI